jgi:ATP synthase F1 gamma subunit
VRRASNIQKDMVQIHTVEDLTEVFESIASMRISKIHNRVIASKEFFAELWTTYRSLRVDPKERLKRPNQAERARNVFVAITAEGKLSGGVDEQIITTMLDARKDPVNTDLIVIGSHGVSQLQQRKIPASHTFKMPASDVSFSVADVIEALNKYHQISVFYQTYDSLRVQKVARIELISAVRELGKDVTDEDKDIEIVTSRDYIFEPNIDKIANYMESVMMGVALIQVIMESKLAQYANRFNTMSRAKIRARDLTDEYRRQFYRAKRAESDERQKEIIKVVRSHERHWAN